MKMIKLQLLAAAATLCISTGCMAELNITTRAMQKATTPAAALAELKAGNKRYINKRTRQYDLVEIDRITAKKGQFPFAFVLACVDSRVSPRTAFDQGNANIFTGAVAGNVINKHMLGSMEFATKVAGSKLIVIMGHSHCGAVAAACTNVQLGNITSLVDTIRPAVKTVKSAQPTGKCKQVAFVNHIARQNVVNMIRMTLKQSPIIASEVKKGQISIVGAMEYIGTGQVVFFDKNGKNI